MAETIVTDTATGHRNALRRLLADMALISERLEPMRYHSGRFIELAHNPTDPPDYSAEIDELRNAATLMLAIVDADEDHCGRLASMAEDKLRAVIAKLEGPSA